MEEIVALIKLLFRAGMIAGSLAQENAVALPENKEELFGFVSRSGNEFLSNGGNPENWDEFIAERLAAAYCRGTSSDSVRKFSPN